MEDLALPQVVTLLELLNTSYLIDEDRQELESWLDDNLDDGQKSRLRKVTTE